MKTIFLLIIGLTLSGWGWAEMPQVAVAAVVGPVKPPAVAESEAEPGAPAASSAELPAPHPQSPEEALRRELDRLALERDTLLAQNSLARAKLEKELSDRRAALERERLTLDEQRQKEDVRMAEDRCKLEEQLGKLRLESERLQLEHAVVKAQAEIENTRVKMKESEARAEIAALQVKMERQDVEITSGNYTGAKPVYLENPLEGNTLVISDRRIALNGPITAETSEAVSSRINYFNNKDTKHPIFIVIDSSPGGSVMAGYHILKSMESSQAPIYVVVKSFAASMAACVATCADKSFCYPNAVILHHQISGGTFGNLTQHRESLKEIEEWWRRLSEPVAKKMGMTTDDFVKRMYNQVSTGDWTEFGDKAAELKWIDHVVGEIRETSLLKNPDVARPASTNTTSTPPNPKPGIGEDRAGAVLTELVDEKGQPYVRLPRLGPKDFYYLYDPDGYFRML